MRNVSQSKIRSKTIYKITVIAILILFLLISFLLSISFGAYKIPIKAVIKSVFIDKEGLNRNIVWNVRVPRTLVAALVGVCLSISGGILQGVMKNPLASPNIIGVSAGAGLMATVCIVLFPKFENLVTPVAFVGALTTTAVIYLLSWKNGIKPLRMVLSGIAISSLLSALINLILIFYPDRVQDTLGFTIGSLSVKGWDDFRLLLPYAVIGLLLSLIVSKKINILMLGDEIATSLGLNVEVTRFVLIAIASLLSASSVSVVGLLGFVGLIVPHTMRLIIGSDYRYLFIASALFGASLMMFCDMLARIVAKPIELPVGIIMAILGVPFFLYLLRGGVKSDRS
ncbi:iron ABC transporter permease [Clostridiaceae bacterium M8S5]|nr:iron ABC transporter permease [Clostridiaceae bacterium M8S5]